MYKLMSLGLLFLLIACSGAPDPSGYWELSIKLQGQTLPVLISLNKPEKGVITGTLYNGSEELNLEGTMAGDNTFELAIAAHYAKLDGKFTDTNIQGFWTRTNKEDYRVSFEGVKTSKASLFKEYESSATPIKVDGKWKIDLGGEKYGLGVFEQIGARVQGSILTNTGDYRFLDGYIKQNKLMLYGFDGVFSFVLDLIINKDKFVATMFAGKDTSKKIMGVRDEEFALDNPYEMTKKTSESALRLKLKNIAGEVVDLRGDGYKGKAKIIQLFGSWCPNCHDETRFFTKWRRANTEKVKDLKFIALSFERASSEKEALKNLKKVVKKLEIDYDVILADYNKTVKVSSLLPIENSVAFPTTFYVDRDNNIVKIHTGFSGQATGNYFGNWKKDFNTTVDEILKIEQF